MATEDETKGKTEVTPQPEAPPAKKTTEVPSQAKAPAAGSGFTGWLGRKLVHPIFLFVVLLIAALMVRPVLYGEPASAAMWWLVGVLILLGLLDLADVSRFQKPESAAKLEDIPPLGLVTGSVRALTGLTLLVAFFFFLLVAPKIITDSQLLEKMVMLIGGWLGVVIGFYFGSRTAERHEPKKPSGQPPGTATGAATSAGAATAPGTVTSTGASTPTGAATPTGEGGR